MIIDLTKENFDETIQSPDPILVDFWAAWCGPCMMQGEVLHDVDDEHPGAQIGKVNVDEERDLAVQFGISVIPTMIIFKDGTPVETVNGLHQKADIVALLRKHGAAI